MSLGFRGGVCQVCEFFSLSSTGYDLGSLPPPSLLTCVAVTPLVFQTTSCLAAPTSVLATSQSEAANPAPPLLWSAASTLVGPSLQPLPSALSATSPSGGIILSPAGEVLSEKLVARSALGNLWK